MNGTWTTWLLAGALVASLHANLTGWRTHDTVEEEPATGCVDAAALGLTGDQRRALDELCRTRCAEVDELEARARERLGELRRRLGAAEIDEDGLRELAREVSDLRERALLACIDALAGVRAVLDGAQLTALLEGCCTSMECCGDGAGPTEDAGKGSAIR